MKHKRLLEVMNNKKHFTANPLLQDEIKSVVVPFKRGSVDHGATRKAMMGVIDTWPEEKKTRFHNTTKESFQSKDKNTANMSNLVTEEVD